MAECNAARINAMKIKWIGPMLLGAAVALGACAPTQQGGDETADPTPTASPTVEAAAETPEARETPEADETPKPAETPYDY
jgi:hypothetical protein